MGKTLPVKNQIGESKENSDSNKSIRKIEKKALNTRKPKKIAPRKIQRIDPPRIETPKINLGEDESGSTSPSPEVQRSIEEEGPINYEDYYSKYSEYVSEMQREEDEKEESSTKLLHRMRMSKNHTPVQNVSPDTFSDNFGK